MKRFFNNDDSNRDEEEFEFEDEENEGDGEGFVEMNANEYLESAQNDLVEIELNQQLLRDATNIARSDWLWIFRNAETKIRRIENIFKRLVVLLNFEQGSVRDETEE